MSFHYGYHCHDPSHHLPLLLRMQYRYYVTVASPFHHCHWTAVEWAFFLVHLSLVLFLAGLIPLWTEVMVAMVVIDLTQVYMELLKLSRLLKH